GTLPAETRLHSSLEGVYPDQCSGKIALRFNCQPHSAQEFSQSLKNIPLIAAFAFLDIAAIAMRFTTSKQQAISRKV
ncbi:hypothetical protein AB9F38_35630, partial [Rhizobium leguminosarum]